MWFWWLKRLGLGKNRYEFIQHYFLPVCPKRHSDSHRHADWRALGSHLSSAMSSWQNGLYYDRRNPIASPLHILVRLKALTFPLKGLGLLLLTLPPPPDCLDLPTALDYYFAPPPNGFFQTFLRPCLFHRGARRFGIRAEVETASAQIGNALVLQNYNDMTLDYFSLCQSGQAGCQAAPDAACARGLDRHANLHVPAAWRASFAGMSEHIGTWGFVPTMFGKYINPISNRGGRLCPTIRFPIIFRELPTRLVCMPPATLHYRCLPLLICINTDSPRATFTSIYSSSPCFQRSNNFECRQFPQEVVFHIHFVVILAIFYSQIQKKLSESQHIFSS